MRLLVCLLLVVPIYSITTHPKVPVSIYRQKLQRAGLDGTVSEVQLARFAQRIEKAKSVKDVKAAEVMLRRTMRRDAWTRVSRVLSYINRAVYWFITFQTQIAKLIDAFNLPFAAYTNLYNNWQTGWQRSVVRYDDNNKIQEALKQSMFKEAAKHLTPSQFRQLEERIAVFEKTEGRDIEKAFDAASGKRRGEGIS